MYHRTVISSFAAVAIGMSCIATDASARGGGGGGGGGRSGVVTAPAPGLHSSITPTTGGYGVSKRIVGVGSGPTSGGSTPGGSQMPDPGGGVAAGARSYAPASYNSYAACGRYPYPPCNGVPAR
jgi:hypothetical protein